MSEEKVNVFIKYHDDSLERIKECSVGDWYDLRSAETVSIPAGDYKEISLGISIKMPPGYTCKILPRSSTFKKYSIIQVNSEGIIDNSFSGTDDVIKLPVWAFHDTIINKNDRICQMCIEKSPPKINFIETDTLDEKNRGGFGSTGCK